MKSAIWNVDGAKVEILDAKEDRPEEVRREKGEWENFDQAKKSVRVVGAKGR